MYIFVYKGVDAALGIAGVVLRIRVSDILLIINMNIWCADVGKESSRRSLKGGGHRLREHDFGGRWSMMTIQSSLSIH